MTTFEAEILPSEQLTGILTPLFQLIFDAVDNY